MTPKNKGFMLAELTVIIAVLATFFMFVYQEFSTTYKNSVNYSKYNNVHKLYDANEFKEFIISDQGSNLDDFLSARANASTSYTDITDCTDFNNTSYCELLSTELEIEKAILTKYNTKDLQNDIADFDSDLEFKNYLETLYYNNEVGVWDDIYIVILKFNDGNFMNINVNKLDGSYAVGAVDEEVPVITLNGSSSITIGLGEEYTELGASATDNVDSIIPITITGEVDVCNAGNYTLTYNASDNSGNAATPVTRTVTVEPEDYLYFDGASDYMVTPNISSSRSTCIYAYITSGNTTSEWNYIIDYRDGLANSWFTSYATGGIGSSITDLRVDGAGLTVEWARVPLDKWIWICIGANTTFTDTIAIFSRYTFGNNLQGYIREVAIYSVLLSTDNLQALSAKQKLPNEISGLRAWYKIEEGSGTTLIDSSGNGYNATVSGVTWLTSNTCP